VQVIRGKANIILQELKPNIPYSSLRSNKVGDDYRNIQDNTKAIVNPISSPRLQNIPYIPESLFGTSC
jgi:hypothetical protein